MFQPSSFFFLGHPRTEQEYVESWDFDWSGHESEDGWWPESSQHRPAFQVWLWAKVIGNPRTVYYTPHSNFNQILWWSSQRHQDYNEMWDYGWNGCQLEAGGFWSLSNRIHLYPFASGWKGNDYDYDYDSDSIIIWLWLWFRFLKTILKSQI